jgi:YD repeat-containing protein
MLVHMRDSQGVEEYYQYDEKSRLIRIQNARHETILANSYDIADLLTSQTLADGGKILYEYWFNQEHTLAFVRITFPNQFSIVWQLTRFGFVRTWPRPPANPAAATPTE